MTASTFTAGDLRRAIEGYDVDVVAGTLQITKEGVAAGSNAIVHEADVAVEVRDLAWRITKSRYQESGVGGSVLQPGPLSEDTGEARSNVLRLVPNEG